MATDKRYSKSSGNCCVVIGCNNNSRKRFLWESEVCPKEKHNGKIRMFCKCPRPFKHFMFPNERTEASREARSQWIASLNRENFIPHRTAVICSDHFVDGKPTKEHPYPELKLVHKQAEITSMTKTMKYFHATSSLNPLNAVITTSSCAMEASEKKSEARRMNSEKLNTRRLEMRQLENKSYADPEYFDSIHDVEAVEDSHTQYGDADHTDLEQSFELSSKSLNQISSADINRAALELEKLRKCMRSLENVLNWIRTNHGEGEEKNELPYDVLQLVDPLFLIKDEVDTEDAVFDDYDAAGFQDSDHDENKEQNRISSQSNSVVDEEQYADTEFNVSLAAMRSIQKCKFEGTEESIQPASSIFNRTRSKKTVKTQSKMKPKPRRSLRNRTRKQNRKAKANINLNSGTDELFTCCKCDKVFQSQQQLKKHSKSAHLSPPLLEKCPYCGTLESKYKIHEHIDTVHLGKQLHCKFCDLKATSLEDIKLHFYLKHRGEVNTRNTLYTNSYTVVFDASKCNPAQSEASANEPTPKVESIRIARLDSEQINTPQEISENKPVPVRKFSTSIPSILRRKRDFISPKGNQLPNTSEKYSIETHVSAITGQSIQKVTAVSNSGHLSPDLSTGRPTGAANRKSNGVLAKQDFAKRITQPSSVIILPQPNSGVSLASQSLGTTSAEEDQSTSGAVMVQVNQGTLTPPGLRRLLPVPATGIPVKPSQTLKTPPKPAAKQAQPKGLIAIPNGPGQFLILQVLPKTTAKIYKCTICGNMFTGSDNYKEHMRIHRLARKKVAKCKACNAVFMDRSQYELHLSIEHNRNPDGTMKSFNCLKCDQIFNRAFKLKKHLKTEHPSDPEVYLCSACGKSFPRESALKVHTERMHIRERKYKCKICSAAFVTNEDLKSHDDRHRARKLKKCPYCGVMKPDNNFRSHIAYVHEGKRYQCNFCDARISQKCQIRSHLLLKHLDISKTTATADAARVIYVEPTHGRLSMKRKQVQDQSSTGCDDTGDTQNVPAKKSKPAKYNCVICNVSFHDKNALEVHRIRHDMDPEYRYKPRRRVIRIDQITKQDNTTTATTAVPDPVTSVLDEKQGENQETHVPV